MRVTLDNWRRVLAGLAAGCASIPFLFGCDSSPSPSAQVGLAEVETCPLSEAVVTEGHRRLALIIGVGDYLSPKVNDLEGPPNDARLVYEILAGEQGYGFPKENICLLLDDEATTDNIEQAFQKALIDRAERDDVVLVYYAGHGSQRKDQNADEPDGLDETWVVHDSRTPGRPDLIDDRVNDMLASLHEKTSKVTVVLDSCNSGTATRGGAGFTERFADLDETPVPADAEPVGDGDGSDGEPVAALPGFVLLTAASDGTSALERDGRGIFTDALVEVLSEGQDSPLTYAQLARRVPPLVSQSGSMQIPYFQGELNQAVLSNKGVLRPAAWEVKAVGPRLELSGPPLPGLGKNAELRIFDGAASGDDIRDPSQAKATVLVTDISGLNAEARVLRRPPDAPEIRLGDVAVLARPGDDFIEVKVHIRPGDDPGGLAAERSGSLRQAIVEDPEIGRLVKIVDTGYDFELSRNVDGHVVIRDHLDRVRNLIERDELVPQALWGHARQRALLALRGEGGGDFQDNESLEVRLRPAEGQTACADMSAWNPAEGPNREQIVPLCVRFNVEVGLSQSVGKPLLVGALFLSSDGSIYGLPSDGSTVLLQPGEVHTFNTTFEGRPPLDVRDMIVVFGTQETNPVAWHALTSVVRTRSERARGQASPLQRALMDYFSGTRGGAPVSDEVEDTTWTRSVLPVRVEANLRFAQPTRGTDAPFSTREYTIPNFDIRPYLPDDPDTALHKVLDQAVRLTEYGGSDGVDYKQHAWNQGSDAANLELGIDCSRAIWFAFTRAGLSYNRNDRYLTTADMVTEDTWMRDEFQRCDGIADQKLGDILVYRDPTQGDGHVVMVIDPVKRIAWGSHGWDGNAKKFDLPVDRGVEFQKIKFKPDWRAWDRPTMELKACWRYEKFIADRQMARGIPGGKALAEACDEGECRLN